MISRGWIRAPIAPARLHRQSSLVYIRGEIRSDAMSWMGLSMRVRLLSIVAILLGLALIAIASWENARSPLQIHRRVSQATQLQVPVAGPVRSVI
jgi:hypothetical protein